MAFSKVKSESIADLGVTTAKIANDAVTATKVDDDGTGFTVGNLTSTSTVTLGSGGTNWTLPTARGTDKYVLQINGTTGAASWAESLTAPELSSHSYDVSGSTDDGGINAYEAPYAYTGTTNETTTISALSSTTGLKAGQYISGAGIPADTTIVSVNTGASTMVISNAVTVSGTQSSVALKIQKTPGEKNGGKVTLTGANFGTTIGELSVAITTAAGAVIANASYISGLSGGNTITAEWTGTEGSYSTDLTSSYTGKIYLKMTKSGLASNVLDTNTTLTSDATVTTLSTSSQTGGDRTGAPSATSLGTYGSGRTAGGGQDSNTKVLLNFDRTGGTDIEDSSNFGGGNGYKVTPSGDVSIKATPFGDGKSAMYFDGTNDKLVTAGNADFNLDGGEEFTIEFWINPANTSNKNILAIKSGNNAGRGLELSVVSNRLYSNISPDNSNWSILDSYITDAGVYKANEWQHIAITMSRGETSYDHGRYRFFHNGVLVKDTGPASATDFINGTNSHFIILGQGFNDSGNFFEGYIDEFRYIKGTTSNGSGAVYTSNFTVPTSRLTEITNTKLLIHSDQIGTNKGNRYEMTYTGGINEVHNQSPFTNGGSWLLDGSNDYITLPTAVDRVPWNFGTGDFTLEYWIRPTGSGTHWSYNIGNGLATAWEIEEASNEITFRYSGSGSYAAITHQTSISQGGTWYHIAIVRISGTTHIYLDGTKSSTGASTNFNLGQSDGSNLEIGRDRHNANTYTAAHITGIRVTKGLGIYTANFTKPTSAPTKTWSAATGIAANSDESKISYLVTGDEFYFADSATTGTTHTITPTGSIHSQGHKGVAPALTWPASGKATGSSGVYFDGSSDYLELSHASALGTGKFTIDFWLKFNRRDSTGNYIPIMGNQQSTGTSNTGYFNINLKKVGVAHNFYVYEDTTQNDSGHAVDDDQWHHCMVTRNADSYLELWVDGTRRYISGSTATTNYDSTELWRIGHDDNQGYMYKGYLDNIRIVIGEDMTSVSTDPVYSANGTTYTVPTKVYGSFGVAKPDVGTITLVATGEGDYTWSEVAGGTALPGTIAVGSTAHSGSGNSRTHTATITGAFSSGVTSDTTTNGILLKAQNDADATKAITLGSSGGYDGIGITQITDEKPALFSARRYFGTGAARDINGFGFQPDFVWIKSRGETRSHMVWDSVTNFGDSPLVPDTNAQSQASAQGHISKFNADGFSLAHAGTGLNVNNQYHNFIAWAWKAGGAPSGALGTINSSNPSGAGTIANTGNVTAITQSVDQNSGLSITKYTGGATGANQTSAIPHNLGGTPHFIIVKNLGGAYDWVVYHNDLSTDKNLNLNNNTAEDTKIRGYIDAPDGTNINLHSSSAEVSSKYGRAVNATGDNFICYAWKAVSGVSAFGTYEGTGGAHSVTTGFAPKCVIIKNIDQANHWHLYDTLRGGTLRMYLNEPEGEPAVGASTTIAISTTNGFSFGSGANSGYINASGQTYIYCAFA